ncbi:hypothetical protein IKX73_02005 [Candidatus Saccharibacteria bacterium]|nr:hypothetical protein [Candidatus Saccharibacteria bacterium]
MNKDVIYIEPEDDITDIITKIENSKEKIIALVPPKKAGVFRSIVNIKLIAKSGVNADKKIVLVTTDPAIIKLAATTKLPVTKNLQSAPSVPKIDDDVEAEAASADDVVESAAAESEEEEVEDLEAEAKPEKDKDDDEKNEDKDDKEDGEKSGKKAKPVKSKNPVINWIKNHKVLFPILIVLLIALILALVWAIVIAPAASVTVTIRTTTTNFSENASFVTDLAAENVSEGKFYLDEKKNETKTEASFEATGTKNVGDKATGEVVVYTYFKNSGAKAINAGSVFNYGNLRFISDKDASLSWDGKDVNKCENKGEASSFTSGCLVSGRIAVTASEPGAQYNIAAQERGWETTANVGVYSDQAMAGGTSKTITIVQQSDIDEALAKVVNNNASSQAERKAKLLSTIEDGSFIIDSSYKQTVSEPVSTPALGEEVKPGEKATLTVITTDSIYIVDKTKVEEFISEKAKLADDYKIYKMNDPFIENFMEAGESGYIGKIKTSVVSGPKVTENGIIDVIKGKGLGQARADLLDTFNGIDSNNTRIDVSYPWVFSVPNDPTKITVTINVEE